MASLIHRLTCSQVLLCWSRTSSILLCGISWHKCAWSLVNIVKCVAELMVVVLGIMCKWSICISHDTLTITFHKELATSDFFFKGALTWCHCIDCLCFWFEVVQPCFSSHHSVSKLFTSTSDMPKVLKKCSCIAPCVNLSGALGPVGNMPSLFCKHLLLYCTIGLTNVVQLNAYLLYSFSYQWCLFWVLHATVW